MSIDASIVIPLQVPGKPDSRWQPTVGHAALALVEYKLPPEARNQVLNSSVSILSRSVPPKEIQGKATGLVVGPVQSGKTLSFTTVMALARDNGFKLIIVITGTSKPLFNQSTNRIKEDLRIRNFSDGPPLWNLNENPESKEENRRNIQQTLDRCCAAATEKNDAPTVLITVMKQHSHLKHLVSLLQKLKLQGISTLVIDDEADQASLDISQSKNDQSPTYSRLLSLREALPNHTFLQYTATPQAPLLISIIDALSPEFVEVLKPGAGYVGGRELFYDRPDLISAIPSVELPQDHLLEPPASLLEALRTFFIGVTTGLIQGRSKKNANRSMLVHPARETGHHKQYHQWICAIVDEWQKVLKLPETDTDRIDLMGEFRDAYNIVNKTVPDLPPFEILSLRLSDALSQTWIKEVNRRAGPTAIIEWEQSYGWILVGGQAMDRGFTVEGLTVTYMPRAPGVGNADTVQQRGRFFGYKRHYLGFCRLYIEQTTLNLFQDYVIHEEKMYLELQKIQTNGLSLKDWKRAFILSPDMRPCRHAVLQQEYIRGNYANSWYEPSYGQIPIEVIKANQTLVDPFILKIPFIPNSADFSQEGAGNHRFARDVPLARVVDLLLDFRTVGINDSRNQTGVLLQLKRALEKDPDETCTIYQVSPQFPRKRTVDNGTISLFQGRSNTQGGYQGDGSFHEDDQISIQLHFVDLITPKKERIATRVPFIAVWVPERLGVDWISQDQS